MLGNLAVILTAWTFLYEQGDVKVYTDGQSPRSLKAEGQIDAELTELLAVLADVPRRTEWVKSLAEARVIAGDPEEHVWMYSRYDFPWPVQDRDSVLESTVLKDYKTGEVTITFKSVVDARTPVVEGVVRVPVADGTIYLKRASEGKVFVRYVIKSDPGGALPEWVTNYFTKDVPLNTLTALQTQVVKTRGLYEDFLRRHAPLRSPAL